MEEGGKWRRKDIIFHRREGGLTLSVRVTPRDQR